MISILKLILALAGAIASYLNTKNAMDAGEAKATLEAIHEAKAAIDRANAARKRVRANEELDEHDPYRRN